jgi:hypothetical protein
MVRPQSVGHCAISLERQKQTAPIGSARLERMMLSARPVDNLSDMMVDPIRLYGIKALPAKCAANVSSL